ncbi:ribose-phosphate diphosphokinase [Motilimonas pumila]|uniref:Ribose-phosphate pyrophosphokinase n=1 Tax=Motilimonas pumila TaxID=2303987 RepID=A0A418YED9_9GAMM|nr:ribose-phosphate diphosphokinase [Motilimonas pumila]RJG47487.1 ribose-phosphate pyrophosphokinase [Motilimonas pumila]
MKVTAYNQGESCELAVQAFTFSGGEEQIRIECTWSQAERVEIVAQLTSSKAVMQLLMTVDAVKRLFAIQPRIELVIPYFPYARQDRVCQPGEALAVSVMANLINSLQLDRVTVWDAHSEVTGALLNRLQQVPQVDLLLRHTDLVAQLQQGQLCLVAPDAGASKKVRNTAQQLGGKVEVIQAEKMRDVATGEITHTAIFGDVRGKSVLITDDICDGGRTFIELAKVLRREGAERVLLFVSHGIFSQGLVVFEGLIDAIYCSQSWPAPSQSQVPFQQA